jgi:hypothetical protein
MCILLLFRVYPLPKGFRMRMDDVPYSAPTAAVVAFGH